jgi:hypothetical protein
MHYFRKTGRFLLACALLSLFLVGAGSRLAIAQGIVTGSISGTVEDPAGAVIPGAEVTATHVATNREFKTVSTSAGVISLRALPSGNYNVRIEAPRFRSFEWQDLAVNVGADTSLGRVRLEVGSSVETVTVESTAPLMEATTDQISQTFDSQKVASLPVGNSFDSLALFIPGVATAGDVSFSNNNGAEIAVNGQRSRSNNFQLDGQNNNDNSIAGPSIFFGNQDAISEVQVVTNYSAEYGRNMGAVVNYVTKSGTNAFHGTAYEFWTGNTFSSLDNEEKSPVFGFCAPGQNPATTGCTVATIPKLVDNRFGGTIGGPIIKDKIWFFGSSNIERQRGATSPNSSAPGLVPTPSGVQELETAFPNSPIGPMLTAIGPTAIAAGNPAFTNVQQVLVTDQINPGTGLAFPCTTVGVNGCTPIDFGSITRTVSSPFNDYEATGRVDFKLSPKDNFFARYIYQKTFNGGVNFGNGIDVGDWQSIPALSQQIGLDWVRDFSNTFVNQVRASFSRANVFFEEQSFSTCIDKTPTACPADMLLLGSAPQDRVSFGVFPGFPQGRIINVYELQDNASIQKGRHTIKFGGEAQQQRSPNVFLPENNGLFVFTSFSDIVANNPFETQIALGNPRLPFHETDLAFYTQDDWRIKDNLTLNLGLRWEFFQQAINLLHDRTVQEQRGSSPLWDTSLPLSQTTVPRVNNDLHNFSPVVGFAWMPRIGRRFLGEDKTVIRGGFRMGYDPEFYNMFLNVATAAPTVNLATLFGTGLPSNGFFGTQVIPFLQPLAPKGNPGFANQTRVPQNFHNPYSEQWNFGIQHSLNSRIVAEVRYVGNHTVGNFQELNGNPALSPLIAAGFQKVIPPGLRPCTGDPTTVPGAAAGNLNCNFSNVIQYANTAWSKYNGVQTELRIGGWHGLSATTTYTFSKTMDNTSEVFNTVTATSGGGNTLGFAQNPFNTDRAERALSGIDFPHVVGVAINYDLPFYKTQQGILGRLLGGWQVNTTFRYTTGQDYTTVQNFNSGSLCDPTSDFGGGGKDACRPILSNASLPLNSVGRYCDGTTATCVDASSSPLALGTLVSFTDPCFASTSTGPGCAVSPISGAHWIYNDPAAATVLGTPYAGAGRNILRGQPISTANLAIFKNIKVSEKFNMQFQAQAFNVMNVQFRGVPDPTLNDVASGSFQNTNFNSNGGATFAGNIVTDGIGRRRLLFGLKLIF